MQTPSVYIYNYVGSVCPRNAKKYEKKDQSGGEEPPKATTAAKAKAKAKAKAEPEPEKSVQPEEAPPKKRRTKK